MAAPYKKSRQRNRILALLRATAAHPTAAWVYNELKNDFPRLSMGTVYRNLRILHEQGLVEKIDCGSTFDRYEANMEPHPHFVCEVCGSIVDVDMQSLDTFTAPPAINSVGTVKSMRVQFRGVCMSCCKDQST